MRTRISYSIRHFATQVIDSETSNSSSLTEAMTKLKRGIDSLTGKQKLALARFIEEYRAVYSASDPAFRGLRALGKRLSLPKVKIKETSDPEFDGRGAAEDYRQMRPPVRLRGKAKVKWLKGWMAGALELAETEGEVAKENKQDKVVPQPWHDKNDRRCFAPNPYNPGSRLFGAWQKGFRTGLGRG